MNEEAGDNNDRGSTAEVQQPSIMNVANESTSYALPVDILSGMLLVHVRWTNRVAEQAGKDEPPVVTYECRDFDFDTFDVVNRILNRSYVEEAAILAAKDCLDFFGPFKYENMLVDLSLEARSSVAPKSAPASKKAKMEKRNAAPQSDDDSFDKDLIICETEARTRAVANVAAALDEPYVPFKLLFVEGILEDDCDGDISMVEVPMMVVAGLLGDHDNVLFLRHVCSRDSVWPKTFQEIHSDSNVFVNTPAPVVDAILSGVRSGDEVNLFDNRGVNWDELASNADEDEISRGFRECGYGLGLKVGITSRDVKFDVVDSCLNETYDMLKRGIKTVYLPGIDLDGQGKESEDDTSLFRDDKNSTFDRESTIAELRPIRVKELKLKLSEHGVDWKGMIEKDEMLTSLCDAMETRHVKKEREAHEMELDSKSTSLFHRNKKGEIVFSEKEAERACDFVAAADIEERVKASLQKKRFVLPQQTSGVQAHFCNESVYGTLNVLWVSGVIRMEYRGKGKATGAPANEAPFNAWPSKK